MSPRSFICCLAVLGFVAYEPASDRNLSLIRALLSLTLFAPAAAVVRAAPSTAIPPDTKEGFKEWILEIERSVAPERRPVGYIEIGPDALVPGFIDPYNKRGYRWRNVVLLPVEVPDLGRQGFRNGPEAMPPTGFQVLEIDSPIRYIPLREDRYGVGYYDRDNGVFFQWRDVELRKNQLPANAESANLILPTGLQVSWITAPQHRTEKLPASAAAPARSTLSGVPDGTPDARASRGNGPAAGSGPHPAGVSHDPESSTAWPLWIAAFGALAGAAILVVLRRKKSVRTITH